MFLEHMNATVLQRKASPPWGEARVLRNRITVIHTIQNDRRLKVRLLYPQL